MNFIFLIPVLLSKQLARFGQAKFSKEKKRRKYKTNRRKAPVGAINESIQLKEMGPLPDVVIRNYKGQFYSFN